MLGGIAQDLMSVRTRDVTQLESETINTKHEAKIGFYISMGTTVTSGYDKQKHDKFMEKVQSETSTRLGGDPSIKDLNAWAKTVSDNPVVSKFSMKFIVDLLNTQRFPSDTHIADKAKLIKTAPAKGCPIGYIKFSNWRRCYKQVDSLVDLWGTLCGFDTAGYIPRIQVPCGGMYASMNKCPANFQLSSATLGRCYKI
ncbi:unnamed protein product [Rotaria sp. Silwood1]|nr:unnamed protein product [Rotaria sp. Silwood1]